MEKIIVIGSPGAGKSSFSKKLKNITKSTIISHRYAIS